MASDKKENKMEKPDSTKASTGNSQQLMEKIVALAKRRGFVYAASEIYGGFANTFDYGPLGVELKRNIKNLWWDKFVDDKEDILGLDSAIIQNPKTWEASGHIGSFSDPLVECKKCHQRFREDHVEEAVQKKDELDKKSERGLMVFCPEGGEHDFMDAKEFNLMFKTFVGPVEDETGVAYMRPETAQGIFINFKNILDSTRVKIPFGVAQIGKAFRNEITTGNFIFRTREFEQAEIEYFIEADKDKSLKWYQHWIDELMNFYADDLGIAKGDLEVRPHEEDELSHYSIGTSDIEYRFPFGVSELAGIAQRTDFDLKQHEKHSGEKLSYFDQEKNERYIPYVVEPSLGVDRALLAVLCDAYTETDDGRVLLKLSPNVAPYKVAVFPLLKNKVELVEKAREVFDMLHLDFATYWDDRGNIGKRYAYQDEAGTPYCVTVDFDTLEDDTVTIRDRDTGEQERVAIGDLKAVVEDNIKNY